jgi:hypothetical protein
MAEKLLRKDFQGLPTNVCERSYYFITGAQLQKKT